MICGSRARRVSSGVAWLVLAGTVTALAAPAWLPALSAPTVDRRNSEVAAFLADDRDWLARQPAWRLTAPAPADTSGLLAWLRRGESPARADADTTAALDRTPVRGRRSLLAELRDRWLARGFLDASVVRSEAGITVVPRGVYHLEALDVSGDDFPARDRLLVDWLPEAGAVFRPEAYREAARGLVAACAELGHPFPAWLTQQVVVDRERRLVRVTATLLPGPVAVVGPQSTSLPAGRGSQFVIRAAGLRSGQPFRESDLRRGMDRLLARDLYTSVDEPLVHLTTAQDTVGVRWLVVPRANRNRIAVVLGLSRDAEGGSRLSGQVDLDLPDIAGTGRRLSARWNDDGNNRSRFGFSYLEPLIFGTPLDAELAVDHEILTDQYTRFRFDSRWRMALVALWGLEVGLGRDRSTFPEGALERTNRTRGRVAVLHGRGDRTRSGWSAALAIESASRSSTLRPAEEAGAVGTGELGSQSSQRLREVDLAGEWWLRRTVSLAGRASFRQIDTDEKPVPLSEQYRFGGATTLRGYREEEFRGETAAWGGVELRLGRAQRSRVYTFVDVGYFEFSVLDPETGRLGQREGTEVGYGMGLRNDAMPGQIDLAVGFPGSVTFDTAKLHVSLVGSF